MRAGRTRRRSKAVVACALVCSCVQPPPQVTLSIGCATAQLCLIRAACVSKPDMKMMKFRPNRADSTIITAPLSPVENRGGSFLANRWIGVVFGRPAQQIQHVG